MTRKDHDDDALDEHFAAWRRQDAVRAPSFERVVRGRERATRRTWTRAAFACASVALIAVAIMWARTPWSAHGAGQIAFTAGSLRVPTDFLLDQVASLNANPMPTIGTVDWYPLSRIDTTVTTDPRRRN